MSQMSIGCLCQLFLEPSCVCTPIIPLEMEIEKSKSAQRWHQSMKVETTDQYFLSLRMNQLTVNEQNPFTHREKKHLQLE